LVGMHTGTAVTVMSGQRIEIDTLLIQCYRITGREIEYHDVVSFHFTETFQSGVFPLWLFDIRLPTDYRHGVLCQRKGKWRNGSPWTVAEFAHSQKITH